MTRHRRVDWRSGILTTDFPFPAVVSVLTKITIMKSISALIWSAPMGFFPIKAILAITGIRSQAATIWITRRFL